MRRETFTVNAKTLGKPTTVSVLAPENARRRVASLYLYHGTDGSHASFLTKSGVAEFLERHHLIAVMPDIDNSWCCNDPRPGRGAWQDYLTGELIDVIDTRYPTVAASSRRGVAGFSMGGYGAVLLVMKYANLFAVGCSLSGSLAFGHESRSDRPGREQFMRAVAPPGGANDLWQLAEAAASFAEPPALWLEVGRDDHLLETNRRFTKHLDSLSIPHHYAEPPGGHDWTFVDQRLQALLDFAAAHLI
jgi:putative tributyrin esterase